MVPIELLGGLVLFLPLLLFDFYIFSFCKFENDCGRFFIVNSGLNVNFGSKFILLYWWFEFMV